MNYNVKHGSLTAFFASVPGCKTTDRDFQEDDCIRFLKEEIFIPKGGLKGYDTVNFYLQDKARLSALPVAILFQYTIEEHDDVSDKLVLQDSRVTTETDWKF